MSGRVIHRSDWRCQNEVRELLQAVFLAESLEPSRCLWLISPWVSDIPLLDNRTGAFTALEPAWSRNEIRLSEVCGSLLRQGGFIVLATRPDAHNDDLIRKLQTKAYEARAVENLVVHRAKNLHEKGLLGNGYYVSGSMNFTWNGIELLEELVRYDTAEDVIADKKLEYHNRWGGRL